MSIYPSPDKLDRLESKYAMVILAAKRARQLKDGARKLIETRSTNPLTIALEEIAEGMIIPRHVEDATVAAHKAALKPNEPSLEDIIAAGPVIAIETESDTPPSPLDAFRMAVPDADDEDDLIEEDTETDVVAALDEFGLPTDDEDEETEDDDYAAGLDDEEE
jgi:DNA-directed RNA polymerase subunit omega